MASHRVVAPSSRPQPVTVALVLFALVIIGNIVGPLLPSSDGEIVFGIVSALIGIVAASGLWRLRKWGCIASVVVAALNLLLDAPAIAVTSSTPAKVGAALSVLACFAIIVLVTRPEARRAYR